MWVLDKKLHPLEPQHCCQWLTWLEVLIFIGFDLYTWHYFFNRSIFNLNQAVSSLKLGFKRCAALEYLRCIACEFLLYEVWETVAIAKYFQGFKIYVWVSIYLHTTFAGFLSIYTDEITFLNIKYPLVAWASFFVLTLLEPNHCYPNLVICDTWPNDFIFFYVFMWWG